MLGWHNCEINNLLKDLMRTENIMTVFDHTDPTATPFYSAINHSPDVVNSDAPSIFVAKNIQVAGTDDNSLAKEAAYQVLKYTKQAKREVEAEMIGSRSGRVQTLIDPSRIFEVDAFTEASLIEAFQALVDDGYQPTTAYMHPQLMAVVTSWAKEANRYRVIPDPTVFNAVTVYAHALGDLVLSTDRFIAGEDVIVCDPQLFDMDVHKPWTSEEIETSADVKSVRLEGSFSLRMTDNRAAAIIRVRKPS